MLPGDDGRGTRGAGAVSAGAGASDAEDLRVTLRIMDVFNQRVLMPAAGLTGVIGFLLVLRYDMRGDL